MGVFFLFREAIQYVLCLPQLRQRDIRSLPFSFPFGLILFIYFYFFPPFFICTFRHWDDCYVNCGQGHFADCRLKGGGGERREAGPDGKTRAPSLEDR
jgi:hypothetical protein